jgi:hypothetical protein
MACDLVSVAVPLRHRRARPGGALIDQLETVLHRAPVALFRLCPPPLAADKGEKGQLEFRRGNRASYKSSPDRDKPGSWRNKAGITPLRRTSAIFHSALPAVSKQEREMTLNLDIVLENTP